MDVFLYLPLNVPHNANISNVSIEMQNFNAQWNANIPHGASIQQAVSSS